MALSSKERQHFRSLAHKLNPVVILGNQGLTEAVQKEIEHALEAHELIKIRINAATREDRESIMHAICAKQAAEPIQMVGHVGTIYRKRKIKQPSPE
jgi:RNA-binding protein